MAIWAKNLTANWSLFTSLFCWIAANFFHINFLHLGAHNETRRWRRRKQQKRNNGKFFTDFFVSELRNRTKSLLSSRFDKLFLLFKQVLVLSAALPSNSHWNESLRVNNCESLTNNNCCNYWRHLSFPWKSLCFIEWRCKRNWTNRPLQRLFIDFLRAFLKQLFQ